MTAVINTAGPVATPPPSAPVPAGPPAKVRDVRYIALRNFAMSITAFNIFGYTLLGFEQPWLWPFLALAVGYTTELSLEALAAWAEHRAIGWRGRGMRGVYEFLLPAHIGSLVCNMMLYCNDRFAPIAFGVFITVSGKYILKAPIRGRMKHFMNPSNFGITCTLLAFGSWVSVAPPYMFTEGADTYFRVMIVIVIATAGTVLNASLTKKIPLIVGWMGGFAIQAFVRHFIWHSALFSSLAMMTGVAFVLFTNYMITDPGTSPMKARPQFMFGASIATVYGVLMVFNLVYTLFFAVTIVCGVRGLAYWVLHFWNKARAARPAGSATDPAPVAVAG